MPAGEMFQIPITEVADIKVVEGPSVIKSENGMLRAYVQLNVRDRDIVGFVEEAQRAVAEQVKLPTGFFIEWSGQFEHQVRAKKTLQVIFPMVVLLMFVILYMTFNDVRDALLIMLSVPGALIGGVIFQVCSASLQRRRLGRLHRLFGRRRRRASSCWSTCTTPSTPAAG